MTTHGLTAVLGRGVDRSLMELTLEAGGAPYLLEMNIEDAKDGAALGARRTIEKHRLFLATSTHHGLCNLWALILLAYRSDLACHLRLKIYAFKVFEEALHEECA